MATHQFRFHDLEIWKRSFSQSLLPARYSMLNIATDERTRATGLKQSDLQLSFRRWTVAIAEFGAVQIIVQALLAVSGLLIVRSVSKEQYALFTIANSMQATCNILADVGIGVGLRSIGGRICDDRCRFGQLLNTAFDLRRMFAVAAFAVSLPVAAWMLRRNGGSWLDI